MLAVDQIEITCTDVRLADLLREAHHAGGDDLTAWGREVAPLAVGIIDASALIDRLAVRRLRESVIPLAPQWPEAVRDQVVSAIEQTISAIEHDGDRSAHSAAWEAAHRAAHRAAWAAREWAAREAAWAAWAAESARAAARSAQAAAEAAWAAARTAEWAAGWSTARTAVRAAAWAAVWAGGAAAEPAWSPWSAQAAEESAGVWRAERERILEELRRAAA